MKPSNRFLDSPENPYHSLKNSLKNRFRNLKADLTTELSHQIPGAIETKICRRARQISSRSLGDEAVRKLTAQEYGWASHENIALVPGARYALRVALETILNNGDEVLIPDPGYPGYRNIIHLAQGVARPYELLFENSFDIQPEVLESLINPRTRVIIVNSPALPTGSTLPEASVQTLSQIAERHDLFMISDEVLHVPSQTKAPSILIPPRLQERTVVINSVSKRFFLHQWRIGWLLAPPCLREAISYILANGAMLSPLEQAALAVFFEYERQGDPWLLNKRKALLRKRDRAFDFIERMPLLSCIKPQAGNWFFPKIVSNADGDSLALHLANQDVGVLAGSIFGPSAKQHIAFSCDQKEEVLYEKLQNFKKACETFTQC